MTSAISSSATPPITQVSIASGPAALAAYSAASSQPDPITPLKLTAVSCQNPIDFYRLLSSALGSPGCLGAVPADSATLPPCL
jgi:hypothetical protein